MALPENAKAVNLGCGTTVAPGWINVDNSPNARLSRHPCLRWLLWKAGVVSDDHYKVNWPKSIIIHDLRKGLPFAGSSIHYVYTSHSLEHLSAVEARELIKEIARILKPGGIARIVVPDLAVGARRYLEELRLNEADRYAAPKFLNWLQLNTRTARTPHRWMYDVASLGAMLGDCGLIRVEVHDYAKGNVPDCDLLDSRPDESLYMEARKPCEMPSVECLV
jgi:predicted SAM-dependent methyltransferase